MTVKNQTDVCLPMCITNVRSQHFFFIQRGEGGGQSVMIGIIIRENVYNYGQPLM